jgi:hypothetical protein
MALFLSWHEAIGLVALMAALFSGALVCGQCIALGVAVAISNYWWLWLAVAAFFPLAALILGQMEGAASYFRHRYRVHRRNCVSPLVRQQAKIQRAAQKHWQLDPRIVTGLVLFGIFSMLVALASLGTRELNPLLATRHKDELAFLGKLNEDQRHTVSELRKTSDELLSQFDGIQEALRSARTNVVANMTELSKSTVELDRLAAKISALQSQRSQMSQKMENLKKLLEGEAPITRGYFDSSGSLALVAGAVLGFVGSVLASFAYAWISSKRQAWSREALHVTETTRSVASDANADTCHENVTNPQKK